MSETDNIPFFKMQGAGNDFVVIDNREGRFGREELIGWAPRLCNRRFGVGGDGLISMEAPESGELDYTMFYRNSDGSDAGMCGNGARCLALLAHMEGMGDAFTFNVHDRRYGAEVDDPDCIRVSFPTESTVRPVKLTQDWKVYQTHTGTEHIVIPISKRRLDDEEWLRSTGAELRNHDLFQPPGTNVNFISSLDDHRLRMETYERGVEDLTLACGTGAIASALVWHFLQQSTESQCRIRIQARGGELEVGFRHDPKENRYRDIELAGPARAVFRGEYAL